MQRTRRSFKSSVTSRKMIKASTRRDLLLLSIAPITVNIEVKVPGQGKNEAMVQLAVWAVAQMEKLNTLSGKFVPIGLPLVSVEGHDWRFYNIYQTEDSDMVRQRVWGNGIFGDSSSILGIYKIITAIQILVEWSHTDYRAWFEQAVLNLLVAV